MWGEGDSHLLFGVEVTCCAVTYVIIFVKICFGRCCFENVLHKGGQELVCPIVCRARRCTSTS